MVAPTSSGLAMLNYAVPQTFAAQTMLENMVSPSVSVSVFNVTDDAVTIHMLLGSMVRFTAP